VKEAVDNALDACEEALVLPDILVQVKRVTEEVFRVTVEDNGPGIVPAQVPFVFGKLLYGSRFHQIKQSRGQQGIGISAAVLYAQLTTGVPSLVISRTDAQKPATRFELAIKIETNEPEVVSQKEVEWDRTHGTRVEIELRATLAAKKRLVDYLKYTSVVNPHARIRAEIDGEVYTFDRVSHDPIPVPCPIQPHPHGIELGLLKRMAADSALPLDRFLVESFSRVGKKAADEILKKAGISGSKKAKSLSADEQKALLSAMQSVAIPAPPTSQCLSPIGEELIRKSLDKEFQLDFVKARTRPPSVYSGHPFAVEAAIGYGGRLSPAEKAVILRFANRVPLMYQQGACAITQAIAGVNWRNYGISQDGLPVGPALILVHVAATNVPFTSESKDAIAAIPEIEKEIDLALKDLGRELKTFLSRRDKHRLQEDRARALCAIIPEIAAKVAEVTDKPVPDTTPLEGRIMHRLVAKKWTSDGTVRITLRNYTEKPVSPAVYDTSPDPAPDAEPKPGYSHAVEKDYTRVWKITLGPGEGWEAKYTGAGGGTLDIQGVEEAMKLVVDLDV
jgi:DNA topoisomerase-6 subunit B